jgi:dolichyl-phosphate beta-glucosyltransferase
MSTKTDVSLIIPVYNETVRLTSGLEKILLYLSHQKYSWELIIVDDGSTPPVTIHKKFPISVYHLPMNSGKGRAIAYGVEKARGRTILFTDIDLSVPIETIQPVLTALKQYPVVIGSRRTEGAKIVVHQTAARELSGRLFTFLSNIVCHVDVADVTCGFKGYTSEAAKELFSHQRIHRWVFDTEIVFLARKKGFAIYELPVQWMNKSGSKVRPWDSVTSLIDLFRIRSNDILGKYNKT